jgi:hypothetical protein
MSGVGHVRATIHRMPGSAADSLREDWMRLGGDVKRAIEKLRERDLDRA